MNGPDLDSISPWTIRLAVTGAGSWLVLDAGGVWNVQLSVDILDLSYVFPHLTHTVFGLILILMHQPLSCVDYEQE